MVTQATDARRGNRSATCNEQHDYESGAEHGSHQYRASCQLTLKLSKSVPRRVDAPVL
jgi:hypothetical protein